MREFIYHLEDHDESFTLFSDEEEAHERQYAQQQGFSFEVRSVQVNSPASFCPDCFIAWQFHGPTCK